MIYLYEGTPGSGKSFHICSRIYHLLRYNRSNVIANFPVDLNTVYLSRWGKFKRRLSKLLHYNFPASRYDYKPVIGHFLYMENSEMTVPRLMDICHQHHKYKVSMINGVEQRIYLENQTLLVIDECAVLFNCRQWGDKSRQEWCDFFTQHRKYGYNIVLIAQHERMLDRQIRYLVEIFVTHRNARYWNFPAKLLSLIAGGSLFVVLYRWQGCKEIMSTELYRYNPMIASIYNSYLIFDARSGTDEGQGSLRPYPSGTKGR